MGYKQTAVGLNPTPKIISSREVKLESALKAIRIWASVDQGIGLIPDHVIKLCDDALKR